MGDIEILEEFLKHYKEVQEKYKDDEIQAEIERSCYFEEVPAEAIENLIQENKELKDTNKKLYELCQGKAMQEFINNECGYIPKSKVKEKIEELEKDVNDFEEYWSKDPRKFKKQKCVDYYKLEALKELLEEGE